LPGKGQLAAGFLASYMAAGFPSIYWQVRGSWQQAFSPAIWQQAFLPSIPGKGQLGSRLPHKLHGSRLSFHLLPGKGQLAAGFLAGGSRLSFHLLPGKGQQLAASFIASYMSAGFPSSYCQVRSSWQQAFFPSNAR
jgi:hypothetical protein